MAERELERELEWELELEREQELELERERERERIMYEIKYPPRLIFELGRIQVFYYPSPDEIASNMAPKDIFWQDMISRNTYGPFPSTYDTMAHYTWIISTQKTNANKAANVIYVDFINKKVIQYEGP